MPRRPDWGIQAQAGEKSSALQIEGAYLNKLERTIKLDSSDKPAMKMISYRWFRFWPDGHVVCRYLSTSEHPKDEDFATFYGCDIGFYVWRGKELLIELYYPHFNYGNARYYMWIRAELVDDKLITKEWWWRHETQPAEDTKLWRVYDFVPSSNTAPKPNW